MDNFRNFLFSRVIPNLSRIGLLTDNIRPKFEELGLLEFENAPDDFECDWNELEKPLEKFASIVFPMGQPVHAFEGNLIRTDPPRHPSNPADIYPMSGIGTIR
jgi:hypothetical protein